LELKNLAPEKRRAIRELHRREDRHSLRLLLFLALYGIAVYAALIFDHPIVLAASSMGIVCAMIGCTVLLHEASHRSLFRRPLINDAVGFLCGLPILLPVSGFRTNHTGHHARRSSQGDPQDAAFPRLDKATTVAAHLLVFLVKAYAFILILPASVIARADRRTRYQISLEYGLIIAFYTGLFWLLPFALVWKLWLLPLLIGALFTQLRAIAEHGLTSRGNVFTATRTVTSNRLASFLMCNINYHLEHHLFPAVPWYNLPKVHRLLQDEYRRAGASSYRSYTAFFTDFARTAWAGAIPNGRLIPEETRHALGC
jgi:fatty acid desaturase